jgi:hypothetical protein
MTEDEWVVVHQEEAELLRRLATVALPFALPADASSFAQGEGDRPNGLAG